MHLESDHLQDLAAGLCADPQADAHLESCASCAQAFASWQMLFDGLGALPRHTPGEGFADRVMARVAVPRPAALVLPVRLPAQWLQAAAAVYGALALVTLTVAFVFRTEILGLLGHAALGARSALLAGARSVLAQALELAFPLVLEAHARTGTLAGLALLGLMGFLVPLSALVLYVQLRHAPATRTHHAAHS